MINWRERRQGPRTRALANKHGKKTEAAAIVCAGAPVIFCLRTSARARAEEALKALVALMDGASSEHVRVAAANAVLDRAFGKPLTGVQAAAEDDEEDDDGPVEVRWLGEN